MKKYKVLKKYPKAIMNSNRMVTLKPGSVVYLKYERQLDRLILLGYIKEILEVKRPSTQVSPAKIQEPKKLIKPQKPKAHYQQEEALEDKTGE
jgi:hypothetical protein